MPKEDLQQPLFETGEWNGCVENAPRHAAWAVWRDVSKGRLVSNAPNRPREGAKSGRIRCRLITAF